MTDQIKAHLKTLELERDIKILLAVESGSRAWGFPSPDSDYDVRIIYIHKQDWYLSIHDRKDTIDYFHGELLDINGWEIRKTLRLLRKSNATPFEWAQSPIIYSEEKGFREQLLTLAEQFFQPYHSFNHYLGIARNSYLKNQLSETIKLKKLFYVIRPVLAINWIRRYKTIPPMDIFNLMKVLEREPVKTRIRELIDIKAQANEDYIYTMEPLLRDYLEDQFHRIENTPFQDKREIPDIELLNTFFRSLLKQFGQ